MPPSRTSTERIIGDFSQSLDHTNQLVTTVLADLREGGINFAKLSNELNNTLAKVAETSMNLKLIESKFNEQNIKQHLQDQTIQAQNARIQDEDKKIEALEKINTERDVENTKGKWGFLVAVIGGVAGVIAVIAQVVLQLTIGH